MTPTDWTDPYHSQTASDVCALLADYVTATVPDGADGRSVANAEVEFLIALVAWESAPTVENTLRLHAAFLDVMAAWRKVARHHDYRWQGTPR